MHYNQSRAKWVEPHQGPCEVCGAASGPYRVVHPDTGQLVWVCTICELGFAMKRLRLPNGMWW